MIQIIGPRLSQWDNGRKLSISGSSATHVHLANRGDTHAVVMDLVDGEVAIPNYLLQTGKELCAYLVLDKITQESKTFPVQKRERPVDYVYDKDRRNYIYELITDAENAVKRANEAASNAEAAKDDLEKYVDDTLNSLSAVLYTEQDLPPKKKAQARANIEVPHISTNNEEPPSSMTKGAVGDFYMNYKSGSLYKCIEAIESEHHTEYIWTRLTEVRVDMGKPGTWRIGEPGDLYMDNTNGDLYICAGYELNKYIWVKVGPVDLSNYYTKDEIDQLADDLATGLSSVFVSRLYVEEQVKDALGDISTALDELHAYAEALKGGGAV